MTNSGGSDVVGHFQAGWEALRRYPMLIVPPLAVHVLGVLLLLLWGGAIGMGALMGALMGGGGGAAAGGIMAALAGGVLLWLSAVLVSLIAWGVVIVMARDGLAGREPMIGAAVGAVAGRLVDVVVASILKMIIVGIGLLLFVVPGVIAGFFLIFTLPAVLLDGQRATDGLKRSFHVVKGNPGPVVAFLVGAILVGVAAFIAAWIAHLVLFLGSLAAAIIFAAGVSYLIVVGVRLYQALPRA